MKHGRSTTALTAGLGLAVTAALSMSPSAQAATNTGGAPLPAGLIPVNILNINDFHGRIDNNGTGVLGKNLACTVVTQKADLGAATTVFLGDGDLIGASPFTSAVQQDAPTIEFLDALGMAASSVGNHEFDKGWTDLSTRVEPLADFAYLGANVYDKGTTTPAMPEYAIVDVGGVRVGVIGAVTADVPNLVIGTGITALDFGDPVAAVNRVADQLTDGNAANGEADVLIAEYHEGGPYSSSTGTLEDQLGNAVFAHLANDTSAKVAAIFEGHTHQSYAYDVQVPGEATGSTRPVMQALNYGGQVARLSLGVDPTTKKVTAYSMAIVPTTAYTPACEADPTWQAAAKIVDDAVAYAAPLAAQPVGSETASLSRAFSADGKEDRGRESTLSNLIAESYLEAVNEPGRLGADFGIMNPGGVRADLPYGTDGTITFGAAASIMPFGNTVKTAEYTGAQVKSILEEQWQPDGASRPYLQLGLSDNLTYTFDPTRARGDRITSITLGGRPIDPAAVYTIVSNSFLVTDVGAPPDGFATMLAGANYRDSGLVDQNMFLDWIAANSPLSPSFAKHAVAVVGLPEAFVTGTKVTFSVEGVNFTSLDASPNTTLAVYLNGTKIARTTVQDVVVSTEVPNRDGQASVSFVVDRQYFAKALADLKPCTPQRQTSCRDPRHSPTTVRTDLVLVAQPSGTRVIVPIVLSKFPPPVHG